MGEALQNYGRQRMESTQEVEVAQSSAPAGGVTQISTTSAVPQAPQHHSFMYQTTSEPPAAPPAAPPAEPPAEPTGPAPSPQGTPRTHSWLRHLHGG